MGIMPCMSIDEKACFSCENDRNHEAKVTGEN